MTSPLNTEAALLVELLRGPGYGLDLIERVRALGGGRIAVRQGVVYPALKDLLRRGLLRARTVSTPGSGRPRSYYELTPKGIAFAQGQRDAIADFTADTAPSRPTADELKAMRDRLYACSDVSEAAIWFRRAGAKASR